MNQAPIRLPMHFFEPKSYNVRTILSFRVLLFPSNVLLYIFLFFLIAYVTLIACVRVCVLCVYVCMCVRVSVLCVICMCVSACECINLKKH